MTSQPAVASVPRIAALDVLRGFALGGILMVNITVMSNPSGFAAGPAHTFLVAFFFDKFYVLFSFLFGYSLTMQFRSAERDGADPRARTVRRCLALMAVGLLHIVFFFSGDVLFGYGLLGLILLSMSRLRPKRAVVIAAATYGLFVLAMTAISLLSPSEASGSIADPERALARMRTGWLDAASYRWDTFSDRIGAFLLFGFLNVLPLFLVGFAAGKTRLLERPERYLPLLPKIQWIGFGIAAPLALLAAVVDSPYLAGPSALLAPLLATAYAATILRLMHHYSWVTNTFAPAGKIAATNYIAQSVITSIIFTGYGLALVGRLPDWQVLTLAITIYAAQLAISRLWVRHHRYGPVEWVLRRATYGRPQNRPARHRLHDEPHAGS
ncbi:DUF418 domain-containing protein [Rhodococcus sp. ACT016]|uniref:DUF418 domain-containing protein n=1 Tax=Rhodococcus sp. ACT016 TaxID=3134808 RepID=UPI003D28A7C4